MRISSLKIALMAIIALAVTGLSAKAWFVSPKSGMQTDAQTEPTPKWISGELINVGPFGFEPSRIVHRAEAFFILVNNRSGLDLLNLELSQVGGNKLKQVTLAKEEPNWTDLLDLPPGEYVLGETEHPDWACRITITAQ